MIGTSNHGATPTQPIIVTLDAARSCIARLVVGNQPKAGLGAVELKPHQRTAIVRIEAAMKEFGGALLADETGLGKTYVALAIARSARHPLVVAPAALRDMWQRASGVVGVEVPFRSIEALSRSSTSAPIVPTPSAPDLVIVDEAHHVRNPATARYRALAALTSNSRVLLLSATPVHNAARDLVAMLALFLGERASALDAAWMARCIIRRSAGDAPLEHMPHVEAPRPLPVDHEERHLDAILALPPPVPPIDGGDGGALLVYSLLRQWSSSQGALVAALRRRLARATALVAAMETGRHPSSSEIAAWAFADGSVQLAFTTLMVAPEHLAVGSDDLAASVRTHAAAVRALLDDLARNGDPDAQRVAHLVRLRSRHPGSKIVAFSQYADTVSTLFQHLHREPGVAALTADGGRVAGGMLSRAEALARFAPRAQGATPPGPAHRIDLLLTTDLLSEGVNLQDASVVVHLDLPWTPARLEQRVGRVARLGSAHDGISVYVMLPPASSERIVRVEQRLREKLRATTRAVGVIGTILPSLVMRDDFPADAASASPHVAEPGAPAEAGEAIRAVIARWGEGLGPSAERAEPRPGGIVAPALGPVPGFLAALGDPAQPRLIADIGEGPTNDPATVLAAVRAVDASVPDPRQSESHQRAVVTALTAVARWRSAVAIRRDLSVDGALRARSRRSVAARIAAITRRAPRHLRPTITALAAAARRTVTSRYGAGAERVLEELAEAPLADEAWLRAVGTFGVLHGADASDPAAPPLPLLVLIVLGRVAPGSADT